ncbi:MAG TPA: transposase [Thermoanaerobaculia bacterium]|nr:transposase [Thermoanaerobaculia bacterium]
MRKYELGGVTVQKRSRLPHWHAEHAIYFVTWRLFDSLPVHVLERLRAERDATREQISRMRGSVTFPEQRMLDAALTEACENFLDQNVGECYLRDHRAAQIVADALNHFDGSRYLLFAWSVMPNHVHAVFSCVEGWDTSRILHSLKGFTSREINKILGRSGTLWQAESYDRCVRDSEELERTIDYVLGNPAACGMENWPFTAMYPARIGEAT